MPQGNGSSSEVEPPLPHEVVRLLQDCCLCFLATSVDNRPHLSLMRFTFVEDQEEDVLILSTRRDTKKFDDILNNPNVAVMVHDFRSDEEEHTDRRGKFSVTLTGLAHHVQNAERAEHYRKLHLDHNPAYPQFIVGPEIAILAISIDGARICNVYDNVTKLQKSDLGRDQRKGALGLGSLSLSGQKST